MSELDNVRFDVASGLSLGCRDRQEDAVAADFSVGAPFGFAVLSDGMGGHASGDMASGIVVTEMFSELKLRAQDPDGLESEIGQVLRDAAEGANRCIALFADRNSASQGMGATLIAPVIFGNRLYWISVGDSPFYLLRGDKFVRLNEDHSYGAQIDSLLAKGMIGLEDAMTHPDRQCLISVLAGREIAHIDCRSEPLRLKAGDILVAASDGVQTLCDEELAELLRRHRNLPSAAIGDQVLKAVKESGCADQDNLSFCIIKVLCPESVIAVKPVTTSLPDLSENRKQIAAGDVGQVCRIDRSSANGKIRTVVSISRKVGKR